ncbi:MAG: gliding motility-associated C-terminal domain-containing protein [Bacteroidota bacterium]
MTVLSVFSPNRDGVNDFFFPQAAEDAGIEIVRFQIFDRWGGALFEQGAGPIGDVRFRWDGRRAGEPLPQGVYVYFLELRYEQGETLQLSGDVTLLR